MSTKWKSGGISSGGGDDGSGSMNKWIYFSHDKALKYRHAEYIYTSEIKGHDVTLTVTQKKKHKEYKETMGGNVLNELQCGLVIELVT